jgi:hypothetical protein
MIAEVTRDAPAYLLDRRTILLKLSQEGTTSVDRRGTT